jgi:hypothetical protein
VHFAQGAVDRGDGAGDVDVAAARLQPRDAMQEDAATKIAALLEE